MASRVRLIVLLPAVLLAATGAVLLRAAQLPDELTLRIIVVGSNDEAQRILERLQRGESFVTIARQESLDPSAPRGGLLGRVSLSSLRPELRQALQGVAVGEVTGAVPVPTGFAVLRVVDAAEAEDGAQAPPLNPGLSAAGSVRYATDVSGFTTTALLLQQYEKPPDWSQDLQAICQVRQQAVAWAETSIAANIATAGDGRTRIAPFDLVQWHLTLGQLHAYHGRLEQAIGAFRDAHRVTAADVPEAVPHIEQLLGIAHLHQGALENDLHRAPGDRCLLSVEPRPGVRRTGHVTRAIDLFASHLTRQPQDLEVRWLLNVAHMLAGSYPAKLAAAHLIPPALFESERGVGRFVDVAARSGLDFFGAAGAAVVDDFDNDGLLDVVATSFLSCDPMRFYQRTAKGSFAERSAQAGLSTQLGGLNALQADYNNDGFVDLLILRGGWDVAQRKSLLRNNGDGTFTDVTAASGLARPATSTQTAVWTDVDRDGFVDLFVGNENTPAQLFRNRGNGSFEDIAAKAGVDRSAYTKGVAAGDYDNDGWPDLYVSNMGTGNFLYRNNRDGTYTELAEAAGVPGPGQGFATWFFDYDNDGWQDLFVTSYFTSIEETAKAYLRRQNDADTLKLYRNMGDGSFQDVTRRVGLHKALMPMGANFGDIDNDGFLDMYLGTGNPSYASLVPSVLLWNRGGHRFDDVTASSGTGELHKGHGVAFADLDRDGDQEIVFQVGGATPGDAHAFRLFENPGRGGDWMALKLVGVKSNRAAIGARLAVTVEHTDGTRRTIHRVVSSGGSFGASPLQQHVGLGSSVRQVDVDVWWPTSDTRQRFTGLRPNRSFEMTELRGDYRELTRPRVPLGVAPS